MYKFLQNIGFNNMICKLYFVFFILHWEIIAWSNFLNLKDTLVHTLTITSFYYLQKLQLKQTKKVRTFLAVAFVMIVLSFLRFYIPLFMIFTFITYRFLQFVNAIKDKKLRILILVSVLFIGPLLCLQFLLSRYQFEINLFLGSFTNPLFGAIRYLFTPIPWQIEPDYTFLFWPSVFNWISLPFMIYGIFMLFKMDNPGIKLLMLYFILISIFYGCFGELQGPRHRLQIDFIIILAQLIGVLSLWAGKGKVIDLDTKPSAFLIPQT
ncbi:hypothetical protein [Chitinophaga silvatica]|nr:hypothetical protein [Chitinophaga silvatica]